MTATSPPPPLNRSGYELVFADVAEKCQQYDQDPTKMQQCIQDEFNKR